MQNLVLSKQNCEEVGSKNTVFQIIFKILNHLKFELYFSLQLSAFSFLGRILANFFHCYMIYNDAAIVFVFVLCVYMCGCMYIYGQFLQFCTCILLRAEM